MHTSQWVISTALGKLVLGLAGLVVELDEVQRISCKPENPVNAQNPKSKIQVGFYSKLSDSQYEMWQRVAGLLGGSCFLSA